MMTKTSKFKVIYIMGRGHSGSTILDLILGNHEKIQSVGELTSGFRRRSEKCSCQALIDDCDFWGSIRRELQQLHPETNLDEYSKMLNYMDRFYRIPQMKMSLGLPSWVEKKYDPMTFDLYSLISKKSGHSYIVDSSKEIGRSFYLLTRFPAEVKVIHLVRDGRGVMWSVLKRLRAGWPFKFMRVAWYSRRYWAILFLTALFWSFGNALGLLLSYFHKSQILVVRYEDLCNNPGNELARIGQFLSLDMTNLMKQIEEKKPLKIGHNIGGNHMRYNETGTFTFKPDVSWPRKLPIRYKRMFSVLTFPVALHYGYLLKSIRTYNYSESRYQI
jgi:hypothetical protein